MKREAHNGAFCLLFNFCFVGHIPRRNNKKIFPVHFVLSIAFFFFFVHVYMNSSLYTGLVTFFDLHSNH